MTRIGIGGLGHAGFPLAVSFAEAGYEVTGYDIDEERLDALRRGTDTFGEVDDRTVRNAAIDYRSDPASLRSCDYIIVTVPTPITDEDAPDLTAVRGIAADIGPHIREGATVVLESTIYPGGTRDVFLPAIADASDLTPEVDFRAGYSPERVVPGRPIDALEASVKVVGGQDAETSADLASVYGAVFDGVHRTPTIEVAEAAKCLENTQRDVNIALVNEFAMAADGVEGLDTEAVLEAAGTKWNFHRYEPGLVGGHCIPVDPYYLISRLERAGQSTALMRTARSVNRKLASHVADLVFDGLARRHQALHGGSQPVAGDARALTTDGAGYEGDSVLLAGMTYKRNSSDVRSRPIASVVERLVDAGLDVVGFDPHADRADLADTYGVPTLDEFSIADFEAMAVLTPHDEFVGLDVGDLQDAMASLPVFVDLQGVLDADGRDETDCIYRRL